MAEAVSNISVMSANWKLNRQRHRERERERERERKKPNPNPASRDLQTTKIKLIFKRILDFHCLNISRISHEKFYKYM